MVNADAADSRQALPWPIELDAPTVHCEHCALDRYGRVVAVCFKGGEQLNRWMVAIGRAVAFQRYSLDYVADEDTVRGNRINIWSGEFDMPWNWSGRNHNR